MTAENNSEEKAPKRKSEIKHKKLIIVLTVVIAAVLVLFSAFLIIRKVGETALRKKQENADVKLPISGSDTLPEDADAYYNGAAYNYNDKLINILLMGVDRKKPNASDTHQADALYLISFDTGAKSVKVIAVSRNTVTDVDSYDINGRHFLLSVESLLLRIYHEEQQFLLPHK